MFATLNLQFLSLDLTDETPATPGLAAQGEPGAEFSDLLRLRIDTGLPVAEIPGDFLPQSGSELPLQALPIELNVAEGGGISEGLLTLQEPVTGGTGLVAERPLPDPMVTGRPLHDPLSDPMVTEPLVAALPQKAPDAAPAVAAPDLVTATIDRRDILTAAESRPLPLGTAPQPVTRTQDAAMTLTESVEAQVPVLRERPLATQVPPGMTPTPGPEQRAIPIEIPRRADPVPLPVTSTEEISEVFKARPKVTQAVQVLGLQPNPQQAPVISTPSAAAPADTGYAAAAQQATDLISTPVRAQGWGEQIGERVLLMAANQNKTAEIRLTPAEMGPLRVQVSVDDGAANVTFQAQHAVTREAIEQALPRLRELLAENGLSLGQANVGEQGVAEGERDENDGPLGNSGDPGERPDDGNDLAATQRTVNASSLLDTYV